MHGSPPNLLRNKTSLNPSKVQHKTYHDRSQLRIQRERGASREIHQCGHVHGERRFPIWATTDRETNIGNGINVEAEGFNF